jgi:hypothetical protein
MKKLLLFLFIGALFIGCSNGRVKLSPTPVGETKHKDLYAPTPPDCTPCKIYDEQQAKKQNS